MGESPLLAVALDIEVRAHLRRRHVVDLCEEEPTIRERHAGAERIAPPDATARAVERQVVRGAGGASVVRDVHERRIGAPPRIQRVVAVRRQFAPAGQWQVQVLRFTPFGFAQGRQDDTVLDGIAKCGVRILEADTERSACFAIQRPRH